MVPEREEASLNITPTPAARRTSVDAGQSVAELALILPALLLLFLAILQIGFILFTQVGLTNAAREAARNASSIPVLTPADAAAAADTYYDRLTNSTNGFLKRNVGGYDSSKLVTSLNGGTRVCYYSYTDPSAATAVMARVVVEYAHPLFIPIIGLIIDGWDGVDGDSRITLGASEDIRVGNAIPSSPTVGDITSPTCNPYP